MGSLEKLGGWWRVWLVISALWIAITAYRADWRGPDFVLVHSEPYLVNEGLGIDLRSGRLMTEQEKQIEQHAVRDHNDASFKDALTRGYLSAKCWGTMQEPVWDTEYRTDPEIRWTCDSTASKLWRYLKILLTLLSPPVLVPLGLVSLRRLLSWIDRGFRLNGGKRE